MIQQSIYKAVKIGIWISIVTLNCFSLLSQTSEIKSTSFYQSDAVFTEVQISNFVDMTGMQMSFNWDSSLLRFTDITTADILNSEEEGSTFESFGYNSPYPGTLIISWVHLDSLIRTINAADDFVLFTIEFENLSNTNDGNIRISETPQHIEVIRWRPPDVILAPFNTVDCIDGTVNTHNTISPLANVEIYPNPFSVAATFDIEGIVDKAFSLSIYNSIGQMVRQETYTSNVFTVSRANLLSGMYFYELSSSDGIFSTGNLSIQ